MRLKLTFLLLTVLTLAACAPAATEPPLSTPDAVEVAPMPVPATDGAPSSTEMVALQTYEDAEYGFAFDYPAGWALDLIKLGDRAPHSIQLTSWTHETGQISEVQPGGTVVNVIVQLWDPQGDLDAFVGQQTLGWEVASILSADAPILANGRAAREFIRLGADGESYSLFTLLGDRYLVISGSGDIDAILQLARSLR